MTGNWDEIEGLLKKNKIPDMPEMAKNIAISKAVEEFEKKYAKHHQGISFVRRLMDTVKTVKKTIKTLIGDFTMRKAYMVAGGICVGIFTIGLLNSTYLSKDILLNQTTGSSDFIFTTEKEIDISAVKSKAAEPVITQQTLAVSPTPIADAAPPAAMEANMDKAVSNLTVSSESSAARSMAVAGFVGGGDEIYVNPYYQSEGRDKFEHVKHNAVKSVKEEPVSTFSIDVDTSSYSFMRAAINNNVLPQKDSVRIEEMINYFPYAYEVPKDKNEPFKTNVSVFPTPWNADTKLLHIGIKGYQIGQAEKPHSNLVFLIDTSGSMNEPNKLPLLKNSFKLLLDSLKADDTVAIVTYAGSAGVVLSPTKASEKSKIINALDNLGAGGSTAGAQGIKTAYQLAEDNFDKNGINRIILATDGDFNVGITNQEELKNFVERKRAIGIFLSVLGFGKGNYNDAMMQSLAQNGNGNAAYIDNLSEARKALVEEASSTLFTIAKDVKIQVEFNPEQIAEYRLIGYETRILNREDFNNDKVDAGDIGSGHTVTAIYEITPVGSKAKLIDDSRYKKPEEKSVTKDKTGEYAFVKIRYKLPDSGSSKLIETPVDNKVEYKKIDDVPVEAKFSTSVAAFAQLLRGEGYIKSYSYDDVINLAQSAKGDDKFGYRAEFINLVRLAKNAQMIPQSGYDNPIEINPIHYIPMEEGAGSSGGAPRAIR